MLVKPPSAAPEPKDSVGVVDIVSKPNRRVEVDTERLSASKIIIHGEGYPWTLKDYYHNQLGMDNVIDDVDLLISNPTQQYHRIKRMEVKLSSPLNPNQNVDEKNFVVNAEFYIDAGIKPNKGDIFTARLEGGVEVLFKVAETEMMSVSKNATYRVDFIALTRMTDEYQEALDRKTTKTYVWSPERLERTGEVLLTEDDYNRDVEIKDILNNLTQEYIRLFKDNRTRSLAVPVQSQHTHDPQLVDFVKWLGITDLEEFNHPPFEMWRLNNPLSFLKRPRIEFLNRVNRKFGLVPATTFNQLRSINHIRYSGYQQTVWCGDYNANSDVVKTFPVGSLLIAGEPYSESKDRPNFIPMSLNPYIFSEGFYTGNPNCVLEEMVLKYIKREAISRRDVIDLYKVSIELPDLEFFYYTPLIILVLKYVGN